VFAAFFIPFPFWTVTGWVPLRPYPITSSVSVRKQPLSPSLRVTLVQKLFGWNGSKTFYENAIFAEKDMKLWHERLFSHTKQSQGRFTKSITLGNVSENKGIARILHRSSWSSIWGLIVCDRQARGRLPTSCGLYPKLFALAPEVAWLFARHRRRPAATLFQPVPVGC